MPAFRTSKPKRSGENRGCVLPGQRRFGQFGQPTGCSVLLYRQENVPKVRGNSLTLRRRTGANHDSSVRFPQLGILSVPSGNQNLKDLISYITNISGLRFLRR